MGEVLTPEERKLLKEAQDRKVGKAIWLLGSVVALLVALLLLASHALVWAKAGEWPRETIRMALAERLNLYPAPLTWVGLDKIYEWLLDSSLAVAAFWVGILSTYVAFAEHEESHAVRQAVAKKQRIKASKQS